MEFEENGVKFVEKIKIDVAGQTEEYSVPKHMDRAAADVLKDFGKVGAYFLLPLKSLLEYLRLVRRG